MEEYQRGVVALIRATGARLTVLHDHRLVDLWRQYSARQYRGGWIKPTRAEVFRFVTWSNGLCAVTQELQVAERAQKSGNRTIRSRIHLVQALNGQMLRQRRAR